MKYLQLNDIFCYRKAFTLSNYIWNIVVKWDFFARRTIGEQFVTAIDSISANIAEGFGRYGKKEKVRFYRISLGSLKESFDWNEKAKIRSLLQTNEYEYILKELQGLPREIYEFIRFTNQKLKE